MWWVMMAFAQKYEIPPTAVGGYFKFFEKRA
jgi:hypothetical protein